MKGIVGFSIENWRMTIGIMIFAVIGGIMAMSRLAIDAEPDIPVPIVNVRVLLPGVSPEDSERLLVKPMERELKSIEGLKKMDGVAASSVGYMVLEFDLSFDQSQAISDVIQKIDRARAEFPDEAKEPMVEELNMSTFPIIVLNMYGNAPERELQRRAKYVQKQLEGIPEILEANISGERVDVLEAVLDPALMEGANVSFGEIAAAINQNNALVTAGAMQTNTGKFNVKLSGLIETPQDLEELVIRSDGLGGIVKMSDISQIRRAYKDVTSYARFNGQNSVSIEITKKTGENIVRTIDKVFEEVDRITSSSDWPATIKTEFSQDKSEYIREMVSSLFSSIVNAVVLVFIVCIAALGLRSALFVGWAIPASFLIALFLFFVQGQGINMLIMFGLILSVGVLVDSAIVIVEYADRKLAEGMPRREAFQTAGERMFWPIISSTLTTLAAFLPLLFWDSMTGKFMSYLPLTMIYVLTASMFMALVFLPTLGSLIGPRKVTKATANLRALSGVEGDPSKITGLMGYYVRMIRTLINFPILVLFGTIIILGLIVFAFTRANEGPPPKPIEFFTPEASDQLYVLARERGNSTPEGQLIIAQELERLVAGTPDIRSVYTVAGSAASQGGGNAGSGPQDIPIDTVARLYTELVPFAERTRRISETMEDLRQRTANIPGIVTEIKAGTQGPPIGKDIGVEVSGNSAEATSKAIEIIQKKLMSMSGVIEIEDTRPVPGIDWELEIDRIEAGRMGLSVSEIGSAIQFVTDGALVAQYRPADTEEEVDIRIRYPENYRNFKILDNLKILTPNGAVPLSSVVKRVPKTRQDSIARRAQKRFYEIKANSQEGYATNQQVAELKDWLSEDVLPEGISYRFLGQAEENAAAAMFGIYASAAILFMMSVILLLQFNSVYHVVLTLSAVVLSIFGVILGLTFYPFISIVLTMTGTIALAGIIVNNNIVLIDTYQRLLKTGYSPEDAALRTAAQRLRPVVLTTLTTIVGLMPLVMGWQADIFSGTFSTKGTSTSDIWSPISYALVCGLGFATTLTLIVTPVMLAAPTVIWKRIKRMFGREYPQPKSNAQITAE